MTEGEIMHLDELMAAAEALSERNAMLERRVAALKGQLKEARRAARKAADVRARVQTKAAASAAYWRQLLFAAVGLTVAVTSLLHSLLLFGGWGR